MSRVGKQMQMAKKKGMSNVDLLRMREIARVEAQKMQQEAEEAAVVRMLGIVADILVHDYWSKSAKKRLPRFIADCMSLYDSVRVGVVTDKEIEDLLNSYAGTTVEKEWDRLRKEAVQTNQVKKSRRKRE